MTWIDEYLAYESAEIERRHSRRIPVDPLIDRAIEICQAAARREKRTIYIDRFSFMIAFTAIREAAADIDRRCDALTGD
jgi:hypothetical protein